MPRLAIKTPKGELVAEHQVATAQVVAVLHGWFGLLTSSDIVVTVDGARVTEIAVAVVDLRTGEIVKRASSLLSIDVPVPADITRLTGITAEMVAGRPVARVSAWALATSDTADAATDHDCCCASAGAGPGCRCERRHYWPASAAIRSSSVAR